MKFTAQQIATVVLGEIQGNPDISVWNLAKIEDAIEGDLCFLANAKYEDHIYQTKASIVLVSQDFIPKKEVSCTLVKVKDAYASFALLLQTYQDIMGAKPKEIIEQPSFISESATIGEKVYVGAFTYIGEDVIIEDGVKLFPGCYIGDKVKIGKNSVLNAGVKVYHECVLGEQVIIHAGTVIGSDGFGFALENGSFKKIPQIGNVIIEDHVEIGANTTVDRATMGSTIIRKGVKMDNLIQIAHNVEIDQHTVVAAQAGISGSSKVGKYCMVGGQAGIVGHIKIANFTRINAQSGVAKEVKVEHSSLTDSPAFDYKSSLKSQVIYRNLPDLLKRINQLENKINELNNKP